MVLTAVEHAHQTLVAVDAPATNVVAGKATKLI